MHKSTKIATCCYCGARAALVLNKAHSELVCGSCGAPLHNLKQVPTSKASKTMAKTSVSAAAAAPKKRKKKRKSLVKSFFDEAFDLIEDVFD